MFAINLTNQMLDLLFQILMRLKIISARHRDLQKHRFADEIRSFLEEPVEGVQFLRNPFDAVQAIDAEDHFGVAEIGSHFAQSVLDAGLLEAGVEFRGLDADGEGLDGDFAVAAEDAGVG
jgi:hypothetical protein